MSMFPHTITIYNRDETADFQKIVSVTVINGKNGKGALVDESQAANIQKSGLDSADAVTVFIPFFSDTGAKTFLQPKAYERILSGESPDEALKYWTLRDGKDFFIRGEVIEPEMTRQQLENLYDGVYTITTVDTKNFGTSDMQHWQIGGH